MIMQETSRNYVLYHGSCSDGFGAAFAAWKKFGDRATYVPVSHGQPPPDLPEGSSVYILDFSYKRDVVVSMMLGHEITILDHHKSAAEDLADLDCALFNMNESGATLAWKYFAPYAQVPPLLQYIRDRDLWLFQLPHSREVSAAIASWPMDFKIWDEWFCAGQEAIDGLARDGVPILRAKAKEIAAMADKACYGYIGGHFVPMVNATAFWSEVGEELCKRSPYSPFAAYYYNSGNMRIWGLRSSGDFDVSKIAKAYGGGGHKNAAGWQERANSPSLERKSYVP